MLILSILSESLIPINSIDYTVQIWQEGPQYIAHVMPLDVMSSGLTPEEARMALDEAVQLFLETAADMGILVETVNGFEGQTISVGRNA